MDNDTSNIDKFLLDSIGGVLASAFTDLYFVCDREIDTLNLERLQNSFDSDGVGHFEITSIYDCFGLDLMDYYMEYAYAVNFSLMALAHFKVGTMRGALLYLNLATERAGILSGMRIERGNYRLGKIYYGKKGGDETAKTNTEELTPRNQKIIKRAEALLGSNPRRGLSGRLFGTPTTDGLSIKQIERILKKADM